MSESTFHKVIDISNSKPQQIKKQQHSNTLQDVDTQQIDPQVFQQSKDKNNNSFISTGSRRFSFFSKSSFATSNSLNFGTKKILSHHPVPRVNITNIIKKRAYLYLDQDLAHTFDELLENGYELVLNKKHERDTLKELEENLKAEIQEIEKEVVPLLSKMFKLKEQLNSEEQLKKKYSNENINALQEMEHLKGLIHQRTQEIIKEQSELCKMIEVLELQNNDIRSQILMKKTEHKNQRDQYEKMIKKYKSDFEEKNIQLNDRKKLLDEKKMEQAGRLRKMENKSKMYLGILKH